MDTLNHRLTGRDCNAANVHCGQISPGFNATGNSQVRIDSKAGSAGPDLATSLWYSARRPLTHALATLICMAALALSACQQNDPSTGNLRSGELITRLPLAERNNEAGEFVRLGPAECGIEFINEVSDPVLLQQEIHLQSGLAAGDYDGDGDIDLYLLGLQSPNKLYRNDGELRFTDVTSESGEGLDGGQNLGSAGHFVDLTGDGRLDLLVSNRVAPNQFFRQDKNGTFIEEATVRGLDDSSSTVSAALFDMENDGDLDVYFTNYRHSNVSYHVYLNRTGRSISGVVNASGEPEQIEEDLRDLFYISESGEAKALPQTDRMLRNDGKGNFSDVTEESGLLFHGWSFQPQACDFNDDGFVDLYVTSDFETEDRMFLNDGNGKFEDVASQRVRKTPLFSMGCDTGDINGDGLPDLVAADMASRSYERSKRQSGDMYEWRHEMLYGDPQPQMRNMLYVNRGEGWMTELAQYAGISSSEWTWAVRLADLNCDGTEELFVTNGMLRDSMDVDMRMQAEQLVARGASDAELTAFWNGVEDYLTENLLFVRQPGTEISFSLASGNWGMGGKTMSSGVSICDLDGDGDPEIVINNTNAPAEIYRNETAAGNSVVVELRQEGANQQAVGARLRATVGDVIILRDVILSRGFATGESCRQIFGLGDNPEISSLEIRWPDGKLQLVAKLEAGYHYTIRRAADLEDPTGTDTPMFEERVLEYQATEIDTGHEEFAEEPLLPFIQSTQGPGAAIADFNADGHLDAYFCGPAGVSGTLMYGDGKGGLADSGLSLGIPALVEEMAAVAFHANDDGLPDLYISAGGVESAAGDASLQDCLLLNQAGGGFSLKQLPLPATSTAAVCPIDVDRDGDEDLIVCAHVRRFAYGVPGSNYLLLNDGSGDFSLSQDERAQSIRELGLVKDIQAADLDNDGHIDLAVSRDWNSVAVLYGNGGSFGPAVNLTGSGWWRGLCLFDADCDGDLDIACSNAGSNTKYHPKSGKPVMLMANDFDGNGTRDLVEVKWKGSEMMPGRGRSCSGYAINTIPEQFPTWKSFANASLNDVYGAGVETAEEFIAEELQSLICFNDGNRSFRQQVLPMEVQWMCAFSACSGDFNADGRPDLFIGGNFSGTQPETGKWNGAYGSLLLGDGAGNFDVLEPHESGIFLHQDVRCSLAADMDEDGLPDLLTSVSNAQPRLLLNRSVDPASLVRHQLPKEFADAMQVQHVLNLSNGFTICSTGRQAGYLGNVLTDNTYMYLPEGLSVEKVEPLIKSSALEVPQAN